MKIVLLSLAASLALVACQTESPDTTPTNDANSTAAPAAAKVSLNITGMT